MKKLTEQLEEIVKAGFERAGYDKKLSLIHI